MKRDYEIIKNIGDRVKANKIKTSRVTLDSYTSGDYTFTSDGYLSVTCGAAGNARASATLKDSDGNALGEIGGVSNNAYSSFLVFVRKGMKVRVSGLENSGHVYFYPIWGGVLRSSIFKACSHFFKTEEVVA